MNALISHPADCEMRGVVRFLQADRVKFTKHLLRSTVNML